MSSTYSEIYTTHLRAQSNILNGQKTQSPVKSKYHSLIKNCSKNKKSSKLHKRAIKSKSVQNSCLNSTNGNSKNKKKSKNKIESSKIKGYNDSNLDKTDYKSKVSYKTDIKTSNDGLFLRNDNDVINNSTSNKINIDNNRNYIMFNTIQNKNNHSNYVKLSKNCNNNNNYFQNYFDIFRMKKEAANFREKFNNNAFNLYSSDNFKNKHDYLKTHSYSNSNYKKSRTYFKANKLKEEIDKITIDYKNKNNSNFRPYSSFNLETKMDLINDEEIYEKNEKMSEEIIDNDDLNSITYHFFDKNMKVPKRIKKYFNSSKLSINNSLLNKKKDKNYEKSDVKTQTRTKKNKNVFRKQSNNENIDNNLNWNIKKNNFNNAFDNAINNNFISESSRTKLNRLNNITKVNKKLTNLLRKIPSSRTFRNKTYDLINYLDKLKENNNKKISNGININNIQGIYPVNECEAFEKIKNNNFFI